MPVYYCTPADIRENVGGTDSGTGTCAQLTDEQLTEAIGRASSKVSAYAGTTFEPDASVPDVVVPDLIASLTVSIATYYATLTYRKSKDLSQWDPVVLGYQDALQTLKDIASGTIQVTPPDPGEPASTAARVVQTIPSIFTYEDSGTRPTGRGGIAAAGAPGSLLRDGW
jgi:phage gp36-like protein